MPVPNVLYELLHELSKLSSTVDLQSLAAAAGTNTVVAAKIIHHGLSIYRLLKKIPTISVAKTLPDLIGTTPILELRKYGKAIDAQSSILAKLEFCNPGGSAHDRLAEAMIAAAEADGALQPGATIIAPASGHTGTALAWVGAAKGYHVVLTMPDTTSPEQQNRMKAYGAEVILTPGKQGAEGAVAKANQLLDAVPGAVSLDPFSDAAGSKVYYDTIGPEIWNAAQGKVDVFVSGVENPDLLSGAGAYLREKNANVRIIAAQFKRPALPQAGSGGESAEKPKTELCDEIIAVPLDAAMQAAALLARTEGLLAGIHSGAAAWAAATLSRRPEFVGKTIVALFPDKTETPFPTTEKQLT